MPSCGVPRRNAARIPDEPAAAAGRAGRSDTERKVNEGLKAAKPFDSPVTRRRERIKQQGLTPQRDRSA